MVEVQGGQAVMSVPQGSYWLERNPPSRNLRAWDAADEYLLGHLADLELGTEQATVLVVNDGFGALACGLVDCDVTSWSDSVIAHEAARLNLERNARTRDSVQMLPMTDPLTEMSGEQLDAVVLKVPKTLSLLEFQLRQLRPLIGPETKIVAGGMVKHIHTSTLEMFEQILGPTSTTLAKKKARLIQVTLDPELEPGPSPTPSSYEFGVGLAAVTLPGVFSNRRLDIGTRYFIQNLPEPLDGQRVLDLGCGNGIVGVTLAQANPYCHVSFVDSSYMAVASARATHERAFGESRDDVFVAGNSGDGFKDHSFDMVAVNPPFHDQHVVGNEMASRMFSDAHRVLSPGGQLWVVANRHLGHHSRIKALFGNVATVASNKKFVVLKAAKSP